MLIDKSHSKIDIVNLFKKHGVIIDSELTKSNIISNIEFYMKDFKYNDNIKNCTQLKEYLKNVSPKQRPNTQKKNEIMFKAKKIIKWAKNDYIFDGAGHLKRRELGRIVFSDSHQLSRLNIIIQPHLAQWIHSRVMLFRKEHPKGIAVIDMAILFEAGMDKICDQIIVITAPISSRQAWLMNERGWSLKETNHRIEAQMDVEIKREKADVVIENTGSLEELKQKARSIFQTLTN